MLLRGSIFFRIFSLIILQNSLSVLGALSERTVSNNGHGYKSSFKLRVSDGKFASMDEGKHAVAVHRGSKKHNHRICGGSLISLKVVISAAHCFEDDDGNYLPAKKFFVTTGRAVKATKTRLSDLRRLKKIFYPECNLPQSTLAKDIALLILKFPVRQNDFTAQPIVINRKKIALNTSCQASGWGQTEDGEYSGILKTVTVQIIDKDACLSEFHYLYSTIQPDMICAGDLMNGKRGACEGDAGGPLVCNNVLTGIVSGTASECGEEQLPAVYTDVKFYASWIDQKLKGENIILPNTRLVDKLNELMKERVRYRKNHNIK